MGAIALMLSGAGAGGAGATGYYRSLTNDHTKLGSTDLSNFPVLIDVTDATLKSVSNGGHVNRTDGFDIIFTTTSNGSTQIPYERELYDPATGHLIAWVKASSLSHTSDSLWGYLRYGDTAITTDQSNKTAVWDSNFGVVYHLGDGSSIGLSDSTSNAVSLTASGSPAATTGKIYGGASIDTSKYLFTANVAAVKPTAAFTVEAWVTPTAGSTGYRTIVSKDTSTVRTYDLDIENTTDKVRFMYTVSGSFNIIVSTSALTLGSTYRLVGTWDGSTLNLYINGSSGATPVSASGTADTVTNGMFIGALNGGTTDYYRGMADEVRLSNIARSADWVSSDYNNQNSPSTFTTIGTETAL